MVDEVKNRGNVGQTSIARSRLRYSLGILISSLVGLLVTMLLETGRWNSSIGTPVPQTLGIYSLVLIYQVVIIILCLYPAMEIEFVGRYLLPLSGLTLLLAVYLIVATADGSFPLMITLLINKGIQAKYFDRLLI